MRPDKIAILEDDANRLLEMEAVLGELLPHFGHHYFDNAQEMIDWLAENLPSVALLSLDHDLPVIQYRRGVRVDAGCGRSVADYLATVPPVCPVIIHSSNVVCSLGMEQVLKDANWPYSRVYPFGDYDWVRKSWMKEVQRYLDEGWVQ